MNEQKFNEIVVKLLMIRRSNDLSSTDDTLLEVAGKIYNSESINESNKDKAKGDWRTEPITPAQEEFFLKRKIPVKKGMTKGEASPLIDEIKKKEKLR